MYWQCRNTVTQYSLHTLLYYTAPSLIVYKLSWQLHTLHHNLWFQVVINSLIHIFSFDSVHRVLTSPRSQPSQRRKHMETQGLVKWLLEQHVSLVLDSRSWGILHFQSILANNTNNSFFLWRFKTNISCKHGNSMVRYFHIKNKPANITCKARENLNRNQVVFPFYDTYKVLVL